MSKFVDFVDTQFVVRRDFFPTRAMSVAHSHRFRRFSISMDLREELRSMNSSAREMSRASLRKEIRTRFLKLAACVKRSDAFLIRGKCIAQQLVHCGLSTRLACECVATTLR